MRAFNRFHRQLGVDSPRKNGTSTVVIAFVAGATVAMVKTVAAALTGSASMLAEAVHSWVDMVTDAFLVEAYVTARRPADATHALGYGRESYVWSLFGSVATFIVGAEFGVWRGITQLSRPDIATDYLFGYVVLGGSFAIQGLSFLQALVYVRKRATERDLGFFEHVFETSDSQLRAVVTEDFLALVGLAVAALGMALHQITGKVVYDAAGSIVIGVLMGLGGLFLINKNRRFLAGVPLPAERRSRAIALLKDASEIKRVTFFYAEFIGPDRILLSARVEIEGDHSQSELARTLRNLELRIMEHKNVGRAILSLAAPEEGDIS
jgi:cation diffusion facilitator family transporter